MRGSGVLLLLLGWELAPRLHWVESWYIPSLTTVLTQLLVLIHSGMLFTHVMVSTWRVVNGLLIAIGIGLPLGMFLGRWGGSLAELLNPLLRLLSQVNPLSLLPVFMIGFGIGESVKLAVVAWVCIWPILFNTIGGVQNLDRQWIKTANSLGLSPISMMIKVLIPGAAPAFFVGVRIGVQWAFFVLIAGEMLGADAGLGRMLAATFHLGMVPHMFAAGLSIVLLGIGFNGVLIFLERTLFFWKMPQNRKERFICCKNLKVTGRMLGVALVAGIIGVNLIGGAELRKARNHPPPLNYSAERYYNMSE